MRLLHQYDVIPADTLRKLAEEIGVGWPKLVRLTFFVMLVFLAVYLVATVVYLLTDVVFESAGLAAGAKRLSLLIPPLAGLLIIWFVSARVRFKRMRNIILKYLRCPHCGYDIRGLPTAPEDGATICPECGCAWKLNGPRAVGGIEDALPHTPSAVAPPGQKDHRHG
jgi:hypothetical protein